MWDLIVSVPDHCLSFYIGLDWKAWISTLYSLDLLKKTASSVK